jgi:hypothetical protein
MGAVLIALPFAESKRDSSLQQRAMENRTSTACPGHSSESRTNGKKTTGALRSE